MALQLGRATRSSSAILHRLSNVLCNGPPVLALAGGTTKIPVATLKATFGEKYPYEKPFPYEEWPLHAFALRNDYTEWRFNDNTKVVVVEGNIGVGKTAFAKRLAKQFDLKYFPPTREKQLYLRGDGYNYDIRGLDRVLPEGLRSYDLAKFYADPNPESGRVGGQQLLWYKERFMDYLFALRHLLSTGQGVVLVRSVYSDMIFCDALKKMGWVSDNFMEHYGEVRKNTVCEIHAPHLHVYLDAPINVLRERINKRNTPYEVGSRNLTDEYLEAIDYAYKEIYLPEMRRTAAVVEVDWTEVGDDVDMDVIAIELEHIELEGIDKDDVRFQDWARICDDEWTALRINIDDEEWRDWLFHLPEPWKCDELMPKTEDQIFGREFIEDHPIYRYKQGWAPEFGHKSTWKFRNPLSYLTARVSENVDLRKLFTKS